jgi:hypothetical protein
MKFLLTMNMPSAKGFLIHQITIEHDGDLEDFCNALNDNEFITVRQWYQFKQPTGDSIWQDRGELVVNTSHIGKVQEYHEQESDDESYRNSNSDHRRSQITRGPIRPGKTSF